MKGTNATQVGATQLLPVTAPNGGPVGTTRSGHTIMFRRSERMARDAYVEDCGD